MYSRKYIESVRIGKFARENNKKKSRLEGMERSRWIDSIQQDVHRRSSDGRWRDRNRVDTIGKVHTKSKIISSMIYSNDK